MNADFLAARTGVSVDEVEQAFSEDALAELTRRCPEKPGLYRYVALSIFLALFTQTDNIVVGAGLAVLIGLHLNRLGEGYKEHRKFVNHFKNAVQDGLDGCAYVEVLPPLPKGTDLSGMRNVTPSPSVE